MKKVFAVGDTFKELCSGDRWEYYTVKGRTENTVTIEIMFYSWESDEDVSFEKEYNIERDENGNEYYTRWQNSWGAAYVYAVTEEEDEDDGETWEVRYTDAEGNLNAMQFDNLEDAETEAAGLEAMSEYVEVVGPETAPAWRELA